MNIVLIVETFIAFIIAVTLHEAAHAAAAAMLGDRAPVAAGRLSLAPTRQMAAVGTIVAIFYSFAAAGGLGWGRPISVDAKRLRVGPNFGLILVALAGPLLNLVLGVAIAFGLAFLPGYAELGGRVAICQPVQGNFLSSAALQGLPLQNCLSTAQPAYLLRIDQFLFTFAVTNIVIAILNIIPLYPLDGYRVLFALLPAPQAISLRRAEPYMEIILLVIFFLVPWLLGILSIGFDPGRILIGLAQSLAGGFAPNIFNFYVSL
ncbi:MAG TPA: site-2 protease family protein [Ktedonobacterales bacterium]